MNYYKPLIMIASASYDFGMFLGSLVTRMGFDVLPVFNAKDAAMLAGEFSPDIFVLDAEGDSWALLRDIWDHEATTRIPCIVIAPPVDEESTDLIASPRCAGVLPKPLNVFALYGILQNTFVGTDVCRRRNLRVACREKVTVTANGSSRDCTAVTLSEGGLFVRDTDPLPVGTAVTMALTLRGTKTVALPGAVMYTKALTPGGSVTGAPGMAIRFSGIDAATRHLLRNYILKLLTFIPGLNIRPFAIRHAAGGTIRCR